MRIIPRAFCLSLCVALVAMVARPGAAQETPAEQEAAALGMAVGEAGGSAIELVRNLEAFLRKYPNAARKEEIERALARAAIELRDKKRIIKYGEPVVRRGTTDPEILSRVVEALLEMGGPEAAGRAMEYARQLESVVAQELAEIRSGTSVGGGGVAGRIAGLEAEIAQAMMFQARAQGLSGKLTEAEALARKAYATAPTVTGARELARWLIAAGREADALVPLADAFSMASRADRQQIRQQMRDIYVRLHGTEAGLGDLILAGFDRTAADLETRRKRLAELDPNAFAEQPLEFTLPSLDGKPLPLSTLRGKVVVMDFWATWCSPCREQHPLYEQVKTTFRDRSDVVFLSVNTDEDRQAVPAFLEAHGWSKQVYFEAGLSRALRVSSIPTTIILGKDGNIISRMNGFIPERFIEMLTERIQAALEIE